jgi:hypothetical protein
MLHGTRPPPVEQPPKHDNAKQIGKTFSKQILTME